MTDELLMRGVDYRCEAGIDLFIDTPASNERAYLQALGRVGRYNDVCTRYVRDDLDKRFETKQLFLPIASKQTQLSFKKE